jgi:argininosuccinate lyase
MKLWQKEGTEVNKEIERFTIGKDKELDVLLAKHDVLGTLAHIQMLETIGLIQKEELPTLRAGLIQIYNEIIKDEFVIEDGIEDVHSQVELL